jgi:hypothetical protein
MARYDQVFQLALKLDLEVQSNLSRVEGYRQACVLSRNREDFSKKDALPPFLKEAFRYHNVGASCAFELAVSTKFNKVPLLLTNRSPYVKIVAKWRLLVGE